MMTVICDTNFLIDSARFKVDLDGIDELVARPYELATLDSVVSELGKIGGRNAKAALKIIEARGFRILEAAKMEESAKSAKGSVDDAIVRAVKKTVEENKENAAAQTSQITQTIVATNDAELRKRIKALGSKVIYLRARKHLEITN